MPGPFDFPRAGRGAVVDAGAPGAGVFAFPVAGAPGKTRVPRHPKAQDAGVTAPSGGGPETSADTARAAELQALDIPRAGAPRETGSTPKPAPVAEQDVLDTLLDPEMYMAVAQGVTQNLGDEIAGVFDPGYGDQLNQAAKKHPIAHGIGQAIPGVAAGIAAAPAFASMGLGAGLTRLGQAGIQGALGAGSEYADSWDAGKATATGLGSAAAGWWGSYVGEGLAGLAGTATAAGRRMLQGAPKSPGALKNEGLLALARAEPTPRIPRSPAPAPEPTAPPLGPPPPSRALGAEMPPVPEPAGPPLPPSTARADLRRTFADEFAAEPPPQRPDLREAFPDEFPPQVADDAVLDELVSEPSSLPPRPPPTELSEGPVPRARGPEGRLRSVPPQERQLRADAPIPEPLTPSPLSIDEPPISRSFVGDPVTSPPSIRPWDASAMPEPGPAYAPGEFEPMGPMSRMRGGPIPEPRTFGAPPAPAPAAPAEPGLLWKGARALTYAVPKVGGAMRAGMDAIAPRVSASNHAVAASGRVLGELGWETGAPAVFGRKVNAQDREQPAYATPETTHYALSAVLSSGASGLSQSDEQTMTSAMVSGDAQKIRAADYRLRMQNPAYARAVERELRSYQED